MTDPYVPPVAGAPAPEPVPAEPEPAPAAPEPAAPAPDYGVLTAARSGDEDAQAALPAGAEMIPDNVPAGLQELLLKILHKIGL